MKHLKSTASHEGWRQKKQSGLLQKSIRNIRLLVGVFITFLTVNLTAQNSTWNTNSGDWNTIGSWSTPPADNSNSVVTIPDALIINASGLQALPDTIVANKLEINNSNFTITSGTTVIIRNPTGTSQGVVVDGGSLIIEDGGRLVVNTAVGTGLELRSSAGMIVDGSLVVDASGGTGILLEATTSLTNNSSGNISLRGNGGEGIVNNGAVVNAGMFLITDSGDNGITNTSNSTFSNNGDIQIFHSNGNGLDNGSTSTFTNHLGATLAISKSSWDGIDHGPTATFHSFGLIAVDSTGGNGINIRHNFFSDGDSILIGTQHPLTGTGSSIGCSIGGNGINISNSGVHNVFGGSKIFIGGADCPITGAGINNTGSLTTDDDGTYIQIRSVATSLSNTGTIINNRNDTSDNRDDDCVIIDVDGSIATGNVANSFRNNGIILTAGPINSTTATVANSFTNSGFISDANGAFLTSLANPRDGHIVNALDNTIGILVAPYHDASYASPLSNFLITSLSAPYENQYAVGNFTSATFDDSNNELSLVGVSTSYNLRYEIQKKSDRTNVCATPSTAITFSAAPTDEIACNGHINVSLGGDGTATISPQMMLESVHADYSGFVVEILSGSGAGTNVVDCAYLGTTVEVMITAPGASGNRCWGRVTVEDKLGPELTIRDTFFYCNTDYAPETLGFPTGTDACSTPITYTYADKDSVLTLCGTDPDNVDTLRIITRTFIGRDQHWNGTTITQTIYELRPTIKDVVFPSSFQGANALQCNSSNTATAVTGKPYFQIGTDSIPIEASCKFGVNLEEKVFDLGNSGKQRIERTWTVMDWCNIASGAAITNDIQIIDITDTIPPTFDSIQASDIVILSTQSHKCMVTIRPPAPTNMMDACSGTSYRILGPSGTIFNNPDDSLTNIPFDTTILEYIVMDSCGNEARDTVTFILKDEIAPLALAQELTINLVDSLGNTWVYASSFDAGSSDNCSGLDSILISKDSINFSDRLAFDCEDVGTLTLTLKVVDKAGNASIATREINISDNGMFCGDVALSFTDEETKGQAAIAGHIQNENGETVESVNIAIGGYEMAPAITGADGSFMFEEIPLEGNYMITPEKDMHHNNGISTFDIVLLSKHVLGLKKLDSPYKMIAADINHSGTISAYDMVLLRQVILGMKNDFPNNTSWRFIDAAYEFLNPDNPFKENYPEAYEIKDLSADMMSLDFVAVKIGDLNNTASVNQLQTTESRNVQKSLNFQIEEQVKQANETVTVDFKASNFQSILGYQFTLDFNGNDLKFEQIKMGTQTSFENFNLSMIQRGIITTSWNEPEAISLAKDEVLFSIVFKAKNEVRISEAISISSDITTAEAYTETEEVVNVNLEVRTPYETTNGFKLYQNIPNPFTGETIIGFDLPTASATTLTIFDMSGKTVKVQQGTFAKGYNQILLDGKAFEEHGMFYYQLETNRGIETKKMILLKR